MEAFHLLFPLLLLPPPIFFPICERHQRKKSLNLRFCAFSSSSSSWMCRREKQKGEKGEGGNKQNIHERRPREARRESPNGLVLVLLLLLLFWSDFLLPSPIACGCGYARDRKDGERIQWPFFLIYYFRTMLFSRISKLSIPFSYFPLSPIYFFLAVSSSCLGGISLPPLRELMRLKLRD